MSRRDEQSPPLTGPIAEEAAFHFAEPEVPGSRDDDKLEPTDETTGGATPTLYDRLTSTNAPWLIALAPIALCGITFLVLWLLL